MFSPEADKQVDENCTLVQFKNLAIELLWAILKKYALVPHRHNHQANPDNKTT